MAFTSRFFGSAGGDPREYTQAQFAQWDRAKLDDGFVPDEGNELEVLESIPAALSVDIDTGQGFVQGFFVDNDALEEDLVIGAAHATLDRIDTIVLNLDILSTRLITPVVVQGTPAGSPVPPTLTQDTNTWQVAQADVLVVALATTIVQADITDRRKTVTGKHLHKGISNQNELINAGFDIWNEGTNLTLNDEYGPEGWFMRTNQNTTVERIASTDAGQKDSLKITALSDNTFAGLNQYPENFEKYEGQEVTLSVRIKASHTMNTNVAWWDGTVQNSVPSQEIGTSFETFVFTFTPTGLTDFNIEFAINSTEVDTGDSWEMSWIKLEFGNVATKYIAKSESEDLRDTERLFRKSYPLEIVPATSNFEGLLALIAHDTTRMQGFQFEKMRDNPTIIIFGSDGTLINIEEIDGSGGITVTTITAELIGENGATRITVSGGNPLVTGSVYRLHYTANARRPSAF